MKPLAISDERELFANQFLRLYSVRTEFHDFRKEYFVVDKGTRVGVLFVRNEHVLLVRQYRFLINDYSWELPGGGVDKGESLEGAARRECLEEAGIVCGDLRTFYNYLLGTDVTNSPVFLFECLVFEDAGIQPNQETNAVKWAPIEQCMDDVLSGQLRDSMTILALLMYCYRKSMSHSKDELTDGE